MTIQEILCDIYALEKELSHFERKYGVKAPAGRHVIAQGNVLGWRGKTRKAL